MPKDWAHEGAEALSFVTAPPNNAEIAYTRFKGQRNLPYKEAEPYKSSLYYWWWAFLRRNKQYKNTCESLGTAKWLIFTETLATSSMVTSWNGGVITKACLQNKAQLKTIKFL